MKTIEMETMITMDGRLPPTFREVFGQKVRVIVRFEEDSLGHTPKRQPHRLMALRGKIAAFQDIKDPVVFQRTLRAEWS